ncbi:ARID domain-containing protein [Mycena chlorophos]|uniref:ARID domain-containing protein n=1 Tax=Mycena chlorophos TaxID=658473 RepID=A0A8H6W9I5_MYCCL|nr:ARID domain-containing protein [Mycena chlorophos]
MSFDGGAGGFGAGLFPGPLDAAQAKQMAALEGVSRTRTTNGFNLGDTSNHLQEPAMAQRLGAPPRQSQRNQGFLNGLAKLMQSRNTPLPPALTGVDMAFDPGMWSMLDIVEPGVISVAGKDVDILKLWGLVSRSGGAAQVSATNSWVHILASFGLEDQPVNGRPVSQILAQYYQAILLPFEQLYRHNQRHQGPQSDGPARRLSSASQEGNLEQHGDSDATGLKRKLESEEVDAKRARQKTVQKLPAWMGLIKLRLLRPPAPPCPVPAVEPETKSSSFLAYARSTTPVAEISDPSKATQSLVGVRSQLSTELSYALTTITVLTTMRGDTPQSGFPIAQCHELLDDMLDLLEDKAFGAPESSAVGSDFVFATNKELVTALVDFENEPFAGLRPRQGDKDRRLGPFQRPGNTVLSIINILRNLAYIADNCGFLAQQERMLDVMLRVCSVTRKDGQFAAESPILSLGDLITVRRETLYTLTQLVSPIPGIVFGDNGNPTTARIIHRAFHLISSFLVDPSETVSPFSLVQLGALKPPLLPDAALETFTRLAQADSSRKAFSTIISPASIQQLFTACIHRLPVSDQDFQTIIRENWLGYMEKVLMTIYALAFIAPPSLKRSLKADRSLGFKSVMLRMVQRFLTYPVMDVRGQFSIAARRAVEAMKVLDDGQDLFDTSEATVTTLSFGMGHGEGAENNRERGTGLLGGHRELAWELLMQREVISDSVLFNELESLARVE